MESRDLLCTTAIHLHRYEPGLPDFSWSKHTKTGKIYQRTTNYTKRPYKQYTYYVNGQKVFQMAVKYTYIFHYKALQNIPEIFGLKINHLATLVRSHEQGIGICTILCRIRTKSNNNSRPLGTTQLHLFLQR
jgi:hypothetical protein